MKDTLIAARALLADPAKWIKRDYAKRADGEVVFGNDEGAVCFCGFGAIQHVLDTENEPDPLSVLLTDAAREMFPDRVGERSFAAFNDHPDTTHADVLAVFDKAIASC